MLEPPKCALKVLAATHCHSWQMHANTHTYTSHVHCICTFHLPFVHSWVKLHLGSSSNNSSLDLSFLFLFELSFLIATLVPTFFLLDDILFPLFFLFVIHIIPNILFECTYGQHLVLLVWVFCRIGSKNSQHSTYSSSNIIKHQQHMKDVLAT